MKPGRKQDVELARFVESVTEYLDDAERDASLPLSYEAIAAAKRVSRGHFSNKAHLPEVAELIGRYDKVLALRMGTPRTRPAPSGLPTMQAPQVAVAPASTANASELTDRQLSARLQAEIESASIIMRRWLGYAKQGATGEDAVLLARDLRQALTSLHACEARLTPLARLREDRLLRTEDAADVA